MNEPTRAVRIASAQVWLLGKCSLCGTPLVREEQGPFGQRWHYHEVPAEPAPEPPHPPAESNGDGPAGSERGTGEAGPETSAQGDFDCCADPGSTIPMDIVARHLHQAIDNAAPRIAEELTPNLLASSAAAIRYIGEHGLPGKSEDFMAGVRFTATLLGHTADDLGAGDG